MIKEGYAELEETAPSTASSTLSLFSRHYDIGGVSTPPLTKRAFSPETSANNSRNLDSAIDSPSTSTMDGMPTDVSDVLSSEVKEVHLFTPHVNILEFDFGLVVNWTLILIYVQNVTLIRN